MKTYYCDACNLPYFTPAGLATMGEVLHYRADHERTCVARDCDASTPARIAPNWFMRIA